MRTLLASAPRTVGAPARFHTLPISAEKHALSPADDQITATWNIPRGKY
jgi:hypothetical protein